MSWASLSAEMPITKSVFSAKLGISETRLALPQRSPSPFSVPWSWRAPARSAARLLATAFSVSLWRVDADLAARDLRDHLADDPLHLMRQGAAIGVAEHEPARAGPLGGLEAIEGIAGIGLVAVEEMLGVEHRLRRAATASATLSSIMAMFSWRSMASATSTWKSQLLPTMQTAGVPGCQQRGQARIVAQRCGPAGGSCRRRRAWRVLSAGGSAKKASSVGLAPGQPPSI